MDSGSRTVSAACEEQKKLSAERRAASICLFAASIQVRFFPGQEEEEDEGIIYSLADDFWINDDGLGEKKDKEKTDDRQLVSGASLLSDQTKPSSAQTLWWIGDCCCLFVIDRLAAGPESILMMMMMLMIINSNRNCCLALTQHTVGLINPNMQNNRRAISLITIITIIVVVSFFCADNVHTISAGSRPHNFRPPMPGEHFPASTNHVSILHRLRKY